MSSASRSVESSLSRLFVKAGFSATETESMVARVSGIPNLADLDITLLSYTLIFYSTVLSPTAIQDSSQLPKATALRNQIQEELIHSYGNEYQSLEEDHKAQLQTSYYRYLSIIDINQRGIQPLQMIRESL